MSLVPYAGGSGSSLPMSVPMLAGDNYTTWAIKVEAHLDAAGLWEAVIPAENAAAAVIAKKDKPARAYLLEALSEDLLMQVSTKKTAAEVWASLKTRFVGADRVRVARLATLRGEFDRLRMADGESLDAFAGKIGGMAARYTGLGTTLGDAEMVKKLLDSVPNRLYAAVAGIEQFCDVDKMPFEEALGRLKAFKERMKRCTRENDGRGGDQLMFTAAQWAARQRVRPRRRRRRWQQHGVGRRATARQVLQLRRARPFPEGLLEAEDAEEEKAFLADIDDPALL